MHDVAGAAGVSTMTVSNVINGRSARVSDATRDRVLQVIADLGYRVNTTARSLRRGRTGIIGLAVPDLKAEYYGHLADRLARRLRAHGLRLAIEGTGGRLRAELDVLATAHMDTYDAVVLSVASGDVDDLDERQPDKPVVLVGERAMKSRYHHVYMDNIGGARLATGHLLDGGSRAIVALGGVDGDRESVGELRVKGYRAAHEERGLTVDPDLVVDCYLTAESAHEALTGLLRRGTRIDGVFALADSAAAGAFRALADAGLAVPEQVAVIGFDNLPSGRYTVPSLSTIEPGNEEAADAVCAMLLAQLAGDDGGPRLVMPEASLVVRDSTRAVPAGTAGPTDARASRRR
ncbi:LacI family DNA-binding transcriptional regulator [Pseudactinotalea suaedae]|uniref:LacI family DNA-binding transcriptional regulator n=1 Tax=Pseudactinotalea suaedae TaxID=1524924 RepID=UPI001390BB7A|nr:LacI family DNA-binding transcriptional regulator [Pseudactinotalea suaedae]